ncbi:hypothetical protein UFOVP1009_6 [uncultured Caudovirales phage]|uniref:Uncharacterized protein n=1 Tax=uncultured Caudovirales phage TaxID=2100421 RepID=A0A6J5Q101_9CAUD|nr:hypothetical protein UFOVP1009_6 [uncultured Caudovirales phage]
MKITLTKDNFIDAFLKSSRRDQFSYEALGELFDYYDNSGDDDLELDIVGICCEWTEYTAAGLIDNYWDEYGDDDDEGDDDQDQDQDQDGRADKLAKEIERNTVVISLDNGSFLVMGH